MMADAMRPMPGAAKAVVPKYGIGMALLIDGAPGITDIVNVNAPSPMVAGISRRGRFALAENALRHRDQDEEGHEDTDSAVGHDRRGEHDREHRAGGTELIGRGTGRRR